MDIKKVDFLVDVPRNGKIEKVQCYIRKMSAWSSREYRKLMEEGEAEYAVSSLVQSCCVDERYQESFSIPEVQKAIEGDVIAELYDLIKSVNSMESDEKKD